MVPLSKAEKIDFRIQTLFFSPLDKKHLISTIIDHIP